MCCPVSKLWHGLEHRPGSTGQVLDDVSEEHARKTITPETFAHGTFTAASIHPCKHAVTMKKLGGMLQEGGREFRVDQCVALAATGMPCLQSS